MLDSKMRTCAFSFMWAFRFASERAGQVSCFCFRHLTPDRLTLQKCRDFPVLASESDQSQRLQSPSLPLLPKCSGAIFSNQTRLNTSKEINQMAFHSTHDTIKKKQLWNRETNEQRKACLMIYLCRLSKLEILIS